MGQILARCLSMCWPATTVEPEHSPLLGGSIVENAEHSHTAPVAARASRPVNIPSGHPNPDLTPEAIGLSPEEWENVRHTLKTPEAKGAALTNPLQTLRQHVQTEEKTALSRTPAPSIRVLSDSLAAPLCARTQKIKAPLTDIPLGTVRKKIGL